jgi:hypothetical protein
MATFMNESIIIGSERPTARGPWPGVALLLALALVGVLSWNFLGQRPAPAPIVVPPVATGTAPVMPAPVVSSVKLAFLDGSGEGAGEAFGCDQIALVDLPVPPTADPAAAAVAALFTAATSTDLTPGNFVAGQDGLSLDEVEAHEDDVHVYLSGAVAYAGVCDDPRLQIQIEETVRANAPKVDEVEIFLNGEPYEAPNEKGEE